MYNMMDALRELIERKPNKQKSRGWEWPKSFKCYTNLMVKGDVLVVKGDMVVDGNIIVNGNIICGGEVIIIGDLTHK